MSNALPTVEQKHLLRALHAIAAPGVEKQGLAHYLSHGAPTAAELSKIIANAAPGGPFAPSPPRVDDRSGRADSYAR